MTTFELYFITGFSIGMEWARDDHEKCSAFIIDLGIVRFLWINHDEV